VEKHDLFKERFPCEMWKLNLFLSYSMFGSIGFPVFSNLKHFGFKRQTNYTYAENIGSKGRLITPTQKIWGQKAD